MKLLTLRGLLHPVFQYAIILRSLARAAAGSASALLRAFLTVAMFCSMAQAQAQVNNAEFVSQNVPASMVAGKSYTVSVVMKNSGTTTWTPEAAYKLGSQNPADNTTWGGRVLLSGPVSPGQLATFTFTVTAPADPGTYNFQWRMLREYVEWFGTSAPNVAIVVTPKPALDPAVLMSVLSVILDDDAAPVASTPPAPAPAPVDSGSFVSQQVPATMVAGQSYTATVTMKNTGNTTWTSATNYKLGAENPADNYTWRNVNRVELANSVAPGQDYTFSFTVTAPSTPGTYNFQWKMVREYVRWFGDVSTNVVVTVYDRASPQPASAEVTYFHNDASGTPMLATDASGAVLWKETYRPYGERINRSAASANNALWFTGKPYDDNTGLSYAGARYYDPLLGRFVGVDPADFDPANVHSFNRYAYANNNPYKFVDPDGHSPVDVAFLLYDVGKLGVAVYTGVGVGPAIFDFGISLVGVASPVPFAGQAIKAARAADRGIEAARTARTAVEAASNAGRTGRQGRLRELAADDKLGSADRGWLKQELNSIERGNRKTLRNPPGKELAHERGREAAKGYDYSHSNLQDRDLHKLQHKHDDFGRANKERPIEQPQSAAPHGENAMPMGQIFNGGF